jgi:hypothetical protein
MSTYRYYQCIANTTPAAAKGPLWNCGRVNAEKDVLDTEGWFTGIGLKGCAAQGAEAMAYESVRRLGCLASLVRPVEGVRGLTTLHVGVKSWVPDSLDPLFVAGNLPGGILMERRGT